MGTLGALSLCAHSSLNRDVMKELLTKSQKLVQNNIFDNGLDFDDSNAYLIETKMGVKVTLWSAYSLAVYKRLYL